MFKNYNFFPTNIWEGIFPEYLKQLEKTCDDILSNIKNADVNKSYQSHDLQNDERFSFFIKDIKKYSNNFLTETGSKFTNLEFTSLWVQEFSLQGGGHHYPHVHQNTHVSGIYYLKCNKDTSKPIFYDPRAGAEMTKLPQAIVDANTSSAPSVVLQPVPGTMIIFPSFLSHGHLIDSGKFPYRFIHWHMKAK
jgi:uncharacterized protein (TIGR02466 family)|tara:strand:+ start:370 stop:945 length:576 start_codon:yes stop_codon:yes gene_type:complete